MSVGIKAAAQYKRLDKIPKLKQSSHELQVYIQTWPKYGKLCMTVRGHLGLMAVAVALRP